jgi:hypothetical protein
MLLRDCQMRRIVGRLLWDVGFWVHSEAFLSFGMVWHRLHVHRKEIMKIHVYQRLHYIE